MSAASPPAPLGSLALKVKTQGGPASSSLSSATASGALGCVGAVIIVQAYGWAQVAVIWLTVSIQSLHSIGSDLKL